MEKLPTFDSDKFVQRAFQVFEGSEKLMQCMDEELQHFNLIWTQLDTNAVGRILRAHLVVEHFMTEYLSHANPHLGSIENARLSFAQKVELIGDNEVILREFKPGIRHLNKIRNRLAHNLRVTVTNDDKNALLSVTLFSALRNAAACPGKPSNDGLDIVEDFTKQVSTYFRSFVSDTGKLWQEVFADDAAKENAAK
jgi:hypothetical protein